MIKTYHSKAKGTNRQPCEGFRSKPLGENIVDMAERAIESICREKSLLPHQSCAVFMLCLDIYNKEILRNEEKLSKGSLTS